MRAAADAIDARWMATGHYARTGIAGGARALLRGVERLSGTEVSGS